MTPNLRNKVQELAVKFATDLAEALVEMIREQPISELSGAGTASASKAPVATKTAPTGRLIRRSDEELQGIVEQIVSVVKAAAEGLQSEEIQAQTGLSKKEVVRPVQLALESGALRKEGAKRGTRYFAGKAPSKPAAKPEPIVIDVHAKKAAKPAVSKKPATKKAAAKPAAKAKKVSASPKKTPKAKVAPTTTTAEAHETNHSDGAPVAGLAASSALP